MAFDAKILIGGFCLDRNRREKASCSRCFSLPYSIYRCSEHHSPCSRGHDALRQHIIDLLLLSLREDAWGKAISPMMV